jgi:hypothetical protein
VVLYVVIFRFLQDGKGCLLMQFREPLCNSLCESKSILLP